MSICRDVLKRKKWSARERGEALSRTEVSRYKTETLGIRRCLPWNGNTPRIGVESNEIKVEWVFRPDDMDASSSTRFLLSHTVPSRVRSRIHTHTHTRSRAVYAHGYTHTHTHTRSRAVYAHGYTHTVGPVYVAGNTRIGRRGTQIARGAVPLTYSTIITHYRPIAGAGACALTSVANYTSSRKGGRGAGT